MLFLEEKKKIETLTLFLLFAEDGELKRLVSEKESEIRLLTRGIEKAEEKVDSLRKELTQRNSTVESLQTTIQSQRGEMSTVKELKEQLKDA